MHQAVCERRALSESGAGPTQRVDAPELVAMLFLHVLPAPFDTQELLQCPCAGFVASLRPIRCGTFLGDEILRFKNCFPLSVFGIFFGLYEKGNYGFGS